METLAPPVVAVIVTCDPGAWFDETLAAFAAQDYPELSILVLDAASAQDPTSRVATGLPGAYVRVLERNDGFGASANQVLGMVEGASYYLFCHDDVAPDPDVVHLLVEEAFRSNAGVVAPKLVSWDDPARLLHVGMAVDKSGAVVDRVEPGELDAGQHDAVRDVFLAPGGCTLVRADLFAELGGFAPEIFVMGEDLDLCWRAQVAGARVVVAPAARVRHLEQLASGRRAVPEHVLDEIGPRATRGTAAAGAAASVAAEPAAEAVRRRLPGLGRRGRRRVSRVTLQSLQRRHELHAVMTCYGRFHRARVLPQVAILAAAEWTIAVLTRHRDRAFALVHAWRWNLARRKVIAGERRRIAALRRFDDAEVRRLQMHGSARLTAYLRRALAEGLAAAHVGGEAEAARQLGEVQVAPSAEATRARVPLTAVAWSALALFFVFGSRGLFGSGLPYVGQVLAMPSVGTFLHRFAAGWQPAGVGTTDPTSPATALLGLGG
ncbi:MAG TPA: glycosyltransferase family 2 protein, partial [Acidimicrobiales bacterium]|nr:glycosyltransferase family 2 protein [Acidimicrobiales bacterium]